MPKLLYDNCELYSLNDSLIGLCSKSRMNWYLKKGIAETIPDRDNSIRLLFETKYENNINKNKLKKENKCYVCETTNNLSRYHVLPSEYKRYLPQIWKDRSSMNILPLCNDCSAEANAYFQEFKTALEEEYEVSKDNYYDKEKEIIKRLSKKILNNREHGITDKEPLQKLLEKLKINEIDNNELIKLSQIDSSVIYKETKCCAEYIMKQIIKENKIEEFINQWKDFFVECMKPKDLPECFYEN